MLSVWVAAEVDSRVLSEEGRRGEGEIVCDERVMVRGGGLVSADALSDKSVRVEAS